jgi:aminoglycoside phosphotransferase family enzyme
LERSLLGRGLELVETHISRVFLGEREVYKFKRPVNLGFLDFSTPNARKRACEAEVTLNRRLAPDVYLGVLAAYLDERGEAALVPEGAAPRGVACEWAVHMRRLPDAQRADVLLRRGALQAADMERVAALLAGFHRRARADEHTAGFGAPEVIAGNVEENFRQVQASIAAYLSADEAAQLMSFQRAFLRERRPVLEARRAAGFVRDGHGDLRLEHLYRAADGAFLVIDCIEFNERFRFADVCADLAFLAMDLAYHDRADLAELLVLSYAREAADYGLYRVLDFYESYRAVVRA